MIKRDWDFKLLHDFSDQQMAQHIKLYHGYVNNFNVLHERILELLKKGDAGKPEYNELKRRLSWEFDGVRLHEYYFDNMKSSCSFSMDSNLAKQINRSFGSYELFLLDFKKTGLMRGIGWVILYCDSITGNLFNVWVENHHSGHFSGCSPLLVMDVWEHAYTVDWKPTERPNYIETFCKNIDWSVVEMRFNVCSEKRCC